MNENVKYKDILKSARELFWKHGFRRVSVEEICKKAGVSKMTYYKFFPNKIELAKTVYINLMSEAESKVNDILTADIPVSEKIKKLILLKIEETNDISQEFMQDFYMGPETELKVFVEDLTNRTLTAMIDRFKEAQKAGIFRKDFKPEFIIKAQIALTEMLNDESLVKLYNSPQELILEFTNLIMYGISPHE